MNSYKFIDERQTARYNLNFIINLIQAGYRLILNFLSN